MPRRITADSGERKGGGVQHLTNKLKSAYNYAMAMSEADGKAGSPCRQSAQVSQMHLDFLGMACDSNSFKVAREPSHLP